MLSPEVTPPAKMRSQMLPLRPQTAPLLSQRRFRHGAATVSAPLPPQRHIGPHLSRPLSRQSPAFFGRKCARRAW